METLESGAMSLTMKETKRTTTLMDLPSEILLEIAKNVSHDCFPSGHLMKPNHANDSKTASSNLLLEQERTDDGVQCQIQCTSKDESYLSLLRVNKELSRIAIDVLYGTNTLAHASSQTKDLLEHPRLVNLLKNLRIHDKKPEDSTFVAPRGSREQNKIMIRPILMAPRLRSLVIDIEPFVLRLLGDKDFLRFWEDGLARFLRWFGLVDLAKWRCTGIARYELLPQTTRDFSKEDDPIRRNLGKVTLCLSTIANCWKDVLGLSHQDMERRHPILLPRPFHPNWFRKVMSHQPWRQYQHIFLDWLIKLRHDIADMGPAKRVQYARFITEEMPATSIEGAVEMAEECETIESTPLSGSCRMDHVWTMIFVQMLKASRYAVLVERRERMEIDAEFAAVFLGTSWKWFYIVALELDGISGIGIACMWEWMSITKMICEGCLLHPFISNLGGDVLCWAGRASRIIEEINTKNYLLIEPALSLPIDSS